MPLDGHVSTWFCSWIWLELLEFGRQKSMVWTPQCYQVLSSHVLVRGNEPGWGYISCWSLTSSLQPFFMMFAASHFEFLCAPKTCIQWPVVSQANCSRAHTEGERTSGHFRQVFVDVAEMLATPIRLQNFNSCMTFHIGHMISIFQTRMRVDLRAACPWQSKANGTNNT